MNESAPMFEPFEPILVRIPDAARMIGRGISFVYEALGDGRLKGVKSDARTLVTMASLREYIASLPPAKITYAPKRYGVPQAGTTRSGGLKTNGRRERLRCSRPA
jgi:hypothetical protein